MENIENILVNCIRDIKSGRSTLEECLSRYPAQRQELEPLLKLALSIRQSPAVKLDDSYKQATKARLLQQVRTTSQQRSRAFSEIFSFGLPPQMAWARVAISAFIIVIILSAMTGGTAYASQSSLPGDVLYPVKLETEDIRLFFAGDPADKVDLNFQFAQTRLEELKTLSSQNPEKSDQAVNGYGDNIESVSREVGRITDTAMRSDLLERISRELVNQIKFSETASDNSSEENGAFHTTAKMAVAQQTETVKMLMQQYPLRAAELNLKMMENRLQRASAKAGEQQYQLMQESLTQYQQFNELGQRILEKSRIVSSQTAAIENLNSQKLPGYIATLTNLVQQVPQEYQSTIKSIQQQTLQLQGQMRSGSSDRGNYGPVNQDSGNGPEPAQSPQPTAQDGGSSGVGNQATGTPSQGNGEQSGSGAQNTSASPSQQAGGNGSGSGTGPTVTPSPGVGEGNGSSGESGSGSGSGTGSGSGSGGSGSTSPAGGSSGTKGGPKP